MYGDQYNIQRFLELADTYFRLTGKTASTMNDVEMEKFFSCISQCSAPEELHKFVKNKISLIREISETMENDHPDRWSMLPPAQRVI